MIRALALLLVTGIACAQQSKPSTQSVTFYVAGVECAACIEMVRMSLQELKGIQDMTLEQRIDSIAKIAFDPKQLTTHEIAQAISGSIPLHGKPYAAWLSVVIPAYSKPEVKKSIDAQIAKHQRWVSLEALDETKGEFILGFKTKPYDPEQLPDPKPQPRQPWQHEDFLKALRQSVPGGIEVRVEDPS